MIISQTILFDNANISGYIVIPEGARIERVWFMLENTLAVSGSNHMTLNVRGSDGTSPVVTARTTDSGASGSTITGKVAEEMSLINADKIDYPDGGYIQFEVDKTGTVAANKVVFGLKLALSRD